eukprot:TRINITY_DN52182_c0_g1_i1.p1 TRINITY_DN52182_c0_g1~~TRINITY_DN52182_c0_g1_i1.p1  ORF type:complete len:150 (-),score=27.00 TRINITY_DN52182_c0_g1_i1:219-638(-)
MAARRRTVAVADVGSGGQTGRASLAAASEAASVSLEALVRSMAHPQKCAVLVMGLSLVAVGFQVWREEVLWSRVLVLLGLFILPAAVGHHPVLDGGEQLVAVFLDARQAILDSRRARQEQAQKPVVLSQAPKPMVMERV